jgi:hypothetical protein
MYNIIINNDDDKLQDPILILKISSGARKNFSKNLRQFGLAFSKRFSKSVLDFTATCTENPTRD